ncbi:glycosyltransferase family 1 protein [Neobacillus niacini]|uniref:glycosyltransferase family 1 protein n=1 Tax=Neobacillus niacini TaxID=86668 RepID=UPI00285B5E2F|nr:glycosyltransferase family 1 protein [Neobacillus niacini]MDR7000599.1 glycosyltransferase involved in cell wall biosynthesis [Neobacillus niacini]
MGSPLRVLHVVVNMNRGGAETLLMNLYRNIDREKVQFDFLTCKKGVFDAEIEKLGGKIHRIPYISEVGHFRYIKELKNFFTENNDYKIVHSHMDKMSGLVLREANRAGIPIRISHSHNTSSEGGIVAKMYKWYAGKWILPNATNLFACSKTAAEWLFKNNAIPIQIIKNGIECEKFSFSQVTREEVRRELNIKNNQLVLGHVGRFNHQKNHAFLIHLFEKHHKINPDSVLLLIGDGPLHLNIQKQVEELKIVDHVKFLGIRNDIHRLLQSFDLFIFPSLHEGLPVSLIEAQAAGLKCLISENISHEVDMGNNLVEFLPINDENIWVQKITNKKGNRNNSINTLVKHGYEIKDTAVNIEKFYLNISG